MGCYSPSCGPPASSSSCGARSRAPLPRPRTCGRARAPAGPRSWGPVPHGGSAWSKLGGAGAPWSAPTSCRALAFSASCPRAKSLNPILERSFHRTSNMPHGARMCVCVFCVGVRACACVIVHGRACVCRGGERWGFQGYSCFERRRGGFEQPEGQSLVPDRCDKRKHLESMVTSVQ